MNARQRLFAAEYVKNGKIGVQAVFAAGYRQGYESACVTASRLLRNAKVKAMIDRPIEKANAEAELTAERVSKEIAKVAFTDVETNSADKMKALSMAMDILGIKKGEIPQAAERSHIVEQTILKRSERTGEDPDSIALSLLESFQDEPEFLQPEHWGKFAYVLTKPTEVKGLQ